MTGRGLGSGGGVSRRTAAVVAAVAGVAVAVIILVGFGRAPTDTAPGSASAHPADSSSLIDIPLVTVAPAASGAFTAPPSIEASASPTSPTPPGGIRANRIRIARLDIDLRIVEGDGIDAPIGKAAHYPRSAWPGGGSNIYVYGHAQVGMFLSLWKARIGDTVELTLVDGTSRMYSVTKIVPKAPWNALQYTQPTKTEQLTLQTSTSNYSTAPRFIVIALPTS